MYKVPTAASLYGVNSVAEKCIWKVPCVYKSSTGSPVVSGHDVVCLMFPFNKQQNRVPDVHQYTAESGLGPVFDAGDDHGKHVSMMNRRLMRLRLCEQAASEALGVGYADRRTYAVWMILSQFGDRLVGNHVERTQALGDRRRVVRTTQTEKLLQGVGSFKLGDRYVIPAMRAAPRSEAYCADSEKLTVASADGGHTDVVLLECVGPVLQSAANRRNVMVVCALVRERRSSA